MIARRSAASSLFTAFRLSRPLLSWGPAQSLPRRLFRLHLLPDLARLTCI